MRLKVQLVLVSSFCLLLPWAASQYLRELEHALRQGQLNALETSARTLAANLPSQLINRQAKTYLNSFSRRHLSVIDGYLDDWPDAAYLALYSQKSSDLNPFKISVSHHNNTLNLLLRAIDDNIIYYDPTKPEQENGDRIVIHVKTGESLELQSQYREYILSTEAEGLIQARYLSTDGRWLTSSNIQAFWREDDEGFILELSMPDSFARSELWIEWRDQDQPSPHALAFSERNPRPQKTPYRLHQIKGMITGSNVPLKQILSRAQMPATELTVVNTDGRALASHANDLIGYIDDQTQYSVIEAILIWLYRGLGPQDPQINTPPPLQAYRLTSEAEPLLEGEILKSWYYIGDYRSPVAGAMLSVGVPILDLDNKIIGGLILEQAAEPFISLTNKALIRMVAISFIVSTAIAAILLLYATWLSYRITQLRHQASSLLANNQTSKKYKTSKAKDEIGDLSRALETLSGRITDYTEYLTKLAGRLSHELKTPLSIVRTSMENFVDETDNALKSAYLDRAYQGLDRLSATLSAMSQAGHFERLTENTELEMMDLATLIEPISLAYQQVYPEHNITYQLNAHSAPILGSEELIAQLLDKLIDNAADFAPSGTDIILTLNLNESQAQISVSNQGPPLPEGGTARLFDSLVSLRDENPDKQKTHLGLGLYIVRLVADSHNATIEAKSLSEPSGACFTVNFPVFKN